MSNDWIKLRKKLRTDPRVLALAHKLATSKAEVIGGLALLWMIADEHGGYAAGVTLATLSCEVGVTGLCENMPPAWLRETATGVEFPEYEAHNGSTAKARAQAQTRMMKHRERNRYAGSVTNASPEVEVEVEVEKSTTTKPRKRGVAGDDVVIPDNLTPYAADVRRWFDYRLTRKPPIYAVSVDAALAEMAKLGSNLPAAIDQSIAAGWQGLFAPKGGPAQRHPSSRHFAAAAEDAHLYKDL